jgi:hypothetical protein
VASPDYEANYGQCCNAPLGLHTKTVSVQLYMMAAMEQAVSGSSALLLKRRTGPGVRPVSGMWHVACGMGGRLPPLAEPGEGLTLHNVRKQPAADYSIGMYWLGFTKRLRQCLSN